MVSTASTATRSALGAIHTSLSWKRLHMALRGTPDVVHPIFVVGTPRSNMTFMAHCIGSHSAITDLGGELNESWERDGGISMGYATDHLNPSPRVRGRDMDSTRRKHLRQAFARELGMKSRKAGSRLVHHNSHLCNKLRMLRVVFPDAALVVNTRDIRSSANSMKNFWEWIWLNYAVRGYLPEDEHSCWTAVPSEELHKFNHKRLFPGGDAAVLGEHWLRMHKQLEQECKLFDPCIWVRYRDFLADPDHMMHYLYTRLGLTPERCSLLSKVDRKRNDKPKSPLDHAERLSLEEFIDKHKVEILSLKHADKHL